MIDSKEGERHHHRRQRLRKATIFELSMLLDVEGARRKRTNLDIVVVVAAADAAALHLETDQGCSELYCCCRCCRWDLPNSENEVVVVGGVAVAVVEEESVAVAHERKILTGNFSSWVSCLLTLGLRKVVVAVVVVAYQSPAESTVPRRHRFLSSSIVCDLNDDEEAAEEWKLAKVNLFDYCCRHLRSTTECVVVAAVVVVVVDREVRKPFPRNVRGQDQPDVFLRGTRRISAVRTM